MGILSKLFIVGGRILGSVHRARVIFGHRDLLDSYADPYISMPKPNRSSATSATRKKHAKKAESTTSSPSILIVNPSKKSGKKKKDEPPRIKAYIPPVKPQAARPDPLDTLGLQSQLDGELYIMLRSLGKKSEATKNKAISDLSIWFKRPDAKTTIELVLPVWVRQSFNLHRKLN